MGIKQRLAALERRRSAERGVLFFWNTLDDLDLFTGAVPDQTGRMVSGLYRRDEIKALGDQGWRCVLICWVKSELHEKDAI